MSVRLPDFNDREAGSSDTLSAIWSENTRRKDAKPETLERFRKDPLGFVKWAWRWGLPGPLERFEGPDVWQKEFLLDLGEQVVQRDFNGRDAVAPIRMTVASGHGIGKGALSGMLNCWILSTRPYAIGTITANTFTQLETKTWAAIQNWFRTSRTAADFLIGASGIRHRVHQRSWMAAPQTCREENSEAFAGQHAATSTSYYIFDESSAIPEKIWEVASRGLTDGEPMFFAFGNPTRSTGKFFRINFGNERHRWNSRSIDSRECLIPNKKDIVEMIEDNNDDEDCDVVRVRVRGLPPRADDLQYIDSETVYAAQKRKPEVLDDEPLVAGVDLARGGGDNAVIRFRCGSDAKSIKPIKIPGTTVRNSMLLVAKLVDLSAQTFNGKKVHTWFLDGTGVGGPMIDRIQQLGHLNFIEIQFGAICPDPVHYMNMRAYMWSKMRDWLKGRGAIDADKELETDLTHQGLGTPDRKDRICLESKESMKKRGLSSPDDGDALALTFAQPVQVPKTEPKAQEPNHEVYGHHGSVQEQGWME